MELWIIKDHAPNPLCSALRSYQEFKSEKEKQSKEQCVLSDGRGWAQVNGLALKYTRGTSAILAEKKKGGKSVYEGSYRPFPP